MGKQADSTQELKKIYLIIHSVNLCTILNYNCRWVAMLIATVKGKCVRRIIVVPVIMNVYKLRLCDF